jgi:hypothetical protein
METDDMDENIGGASPTTAEGSSEEDDSDYEDEYETQQQATKDFKDGKIGLAEWKEEVGPEYAEANTDFFGMVTPEKLSWLDPDRTTGDEELHKTPSVKSFFKKAREPLIAQDAKLQQKLAKAKAAEEKKLQKQREREQKHREREQKRQDKLAKQHEEQERKKRQEEEDNRGFETGVQAPTQTLYDFDDETHLENFRAHIVLGGDRGSLKKSRPLLRTRSIVQAPVLAEDDNDSCIPGFTAALRTAVIDQAMKKIVETDDEYAQFVEDGRLKDGYKVTVRIVGAGANLSNQQSSWALTALTEDACFELGSTHMAAHRSEIIFSVLIEPKATQGATGGGSDAKRIALIVKENVSQGLKGATEIDWRCSREAHMLFVDKAALDAAPGHHARLALLLKVIRAFGLRVPTQLGKRMDAASAEEDIDDEDCENPLFAWTASTTASGAAAMECFEVLVPSLNADTMHARQLTPMRLQFDSRSDDFDEAIRLAVITVPQGVETPVRKTDTRTAAFQDRPFTPQKFPYALLEEPPALTATSAAKRQKQYMPQRVTAAVQLKLKLMGETKATTTDPNTPPFPIFDKLHEAVVTEAVEHGHIAHPEMMPTPADFSKWEQNFIDWEAPVLKCADGHEIEIKIRAGWPGAPKPGKGKRPVAPAAAMNGANLTQMGMGMGMGMGMMPPMMHTMMMQQQQQMQWMMQQMQQMKGGGAAAAAGGGAGAAAGGGAAASGGAASGGASGGAASGGAASGGAASGGAGAADDSFGSSAAYASQYGYGGMH